MQGAAEDPPRGSCFADVTMNHEPQRLFTAIIEQEGEMFVGLCPELDIASQGASVEEALANLREAVDLFLETADPREILERRSGSHIVMQRADATTGPVTVPGADHFELKTGTLQSIIRQRKVPRTAFESAQ